MKRPLPGEITPMRWWNWLYIIVGLIVAITLIGVGAYAWEAREAPSRERTQKIEKLQQEVKELKEKCKP